jgi:hypothetical protein
MSNLSVKLQIAESNLLLSVFIAVVIATWTVALQAHPFYSSALRWLHLDHKPFNCPMCTAFWSCIGFGLLSSSHEIFLWSGFSALLAAQLDKKLNTF